MKKNKKISTLIVLTLTGFLFFSCSSTGVQKQMTPDSYESEEDITKTTENISSNPAETIKTEKKQKKNDYVKDFFTFGNKNEVIAFDSMSTLTPKVFGGLYQQPGSILINLKNNTSGFGSKYQSVYYILQFDNNGRHSLTNAVNQYFSDFENKKLKRKEKNTRKIYGSTPVTLHWGTVSSSTPNYGHAKLYMGYEFKDSHPYFILSCNAVPNEYHELVGDSVVKESLDLKYYFNKELAKDLINKLSDENVIRYFSESPLSDLKSADADEY